MALPAVMSAPTTALAQQFWSQGRTPEDWERLWNLTEQPHRQALVQQFHLLRHFTSITEYGCSVGTNLRLLRRAFPWAQLTGVELNAQAAEFARKKFAGDPRVEIRVGSLSDPVVPPTDVVLTCYSLAYVQPEEVLTVIKRLAAAARVAIIMAEPYRPDISQLVPGLHFPEWMHPFSDLLAGALAGRRGRLMVRKLDPPVDRLNMIATAALA